MLCSSKAKTLTALLVAVAMAIGVQVMHGQDSATRASVEKKGASAGKKTSPLGVKQDRVKRMMQDFEHKLENLAATLAKTEPEQAKRLADALRESKKGLITDRMTSIASLLNKTDLKKANKEQSL